MRFMMRHETASVILNVWDNGEVTVSDLRSETRGEGHATALMQKVIDWADENSHPLFLRVRRYGPPHSGLDNAQLVEFYKKFGFVLEVPLGREIFMMRKPSQKLHGV